MTGGTDLMPRFTQALQGVIVALENVGKSFDALKQPILDLAAALEEIDMDCAYCTEYIREGEPTRDWRRPGSKEDETYHFDCLEIAQADPEFVADSKSLC